MALVELNAEQIVGLIRSLPEDEQEKVRQAVQADADQWWDETVARGEEELRELAISRGANWDAMSDEERESFIDDLMHGDA